MHTLNVGLRLVCGTIIFMMLGIGAAWAPGSIPLDEVMDQLKENEKLIAEINAELKSQNLEAPKVICVGVALRRKMDRPRRRPCRAIRVRGRHA